MFLEYQGPSTLGAMDDFLVDRSVSGRGTPPKDLSQPILTRPPGLQMRPATTALPLWRLRKVERLIEDHISAPLRLEHLAAAAGLSRMHFASQFRVATGLRPHEFVLHRRIERAKILIMQEGLSLVELALDVGFQSQAHFCTIFKRMTGMTASSWKRANQQILGECAFEEANASQVDCQTT